MSSICTGHTWRRFDSFPNWPSMEETFLCDKVTQREGPQLDVCKLRTLIEEGEKKAKM